MNSCKYGIECGLSQRCLDCECCCIDHPCECEDDDEFDYVPDEEDDFEKDEYP